MTEKREGQFDITHPPEPWEAVKYHEDERWSLRHSGDGSLACNALFEEEAKRIAACVNFCRNLRTEFMEQHTLTNIENVPFVSGMFLLEKEGVPE